MSIQAALSRRTVLLQTQTGMLLLHVRQLLLLVRLELETSEMRQSATRWAMNVKVGA